MQFPSLSLRNLKLKDTAQPILVTILSSQNLIFSHKISLIERLEKGWFVQPKFSIKIYMNSVVSVF